MLMMRGVAVVPATKPGSPGSGGPGGCGVALDEGADDGTGDEVAPGPASRWTRAPTTEQGTESSPGAGVALDEGADDGTGDEVVPGAGVALDEGADDGTGDGLSPGAGITLDEGADDGTGDEARAWGRRRAGRGRRRRRGEGLGRTLAWHRCVCPGRCCPGRARGESEGKGDCESGQAHATRRHATPTGGFFALGRPRGRLSQVQFAWVKTHDAHCSTLHLASFRDKKMVFSFVERRRSGPFFTFGRHTFLANLDLRMARPAGLEPTAFCSGGRRSIR